MPRTSVEWINQKNNSFGSWEISGQLIGASYFLCRLCMHLVHLTKHKVPSPLGSETLARVLPEWWGPKRVCGLWAVLALRRGHLVEVISHRPLSTILQEAGKVVGKHGWCAKCRRAVHCAEYLGVPWECPRSSMLWNQGTEDRCLLSWCQWKAISHVNQSEVFSSPHFAFSFIFIGKHPPLWICQCCKWKIFYCFFLIEIPTYWAYFGHF